MAIRPDLVDLGKTLETDGKLEPYYRDMPNHVQRRQETKYKYIGVLRGVEDEAGDDISNDPELTTSAERGQELLEAISGRIAELAKALLTAS